MAENHEMPSTRLIDVENVTGKHAFQLKQPVVRIGRSTTNDFIVLKNTISSSHARIEYRGREFHLTDLGSTNKTQLNGNILVPNVPARLSDGDKITFDVYQFAFVLDKTAPEEKAPDASHAENADPMGAEASSGSGPATIRKIGKYEAFSKLGKGGFGSVWKARDPKGEIVAIKLLNPENLEDERAVRKFFHEAIILSHLDHPHITRFIDFFPQDQNYAIVMDYVQGADLKNLLRKQKGPLPFETCCKIAHQTLDAFQFAHEKKILHRDIKPENIILDHLGAAKITDFGIAKMSSATTQKTAFSMISPLYTPPERFDQHSEVTVRSDIYSLGLVFYEIFTGRHPIDATDPSKVIFAHLNALFDPPEQHADLPHEMSQAILKSLEKDPAERFSDFSEFKSALLGDMGNATVEQTGGPAEEKMPAYDPTESVPIQPGMPPDPERRIEIAPDYFPVGVAVLNLFTETLKKQPKAGTMFSIAQKGPNLKLTIDSSDGERRTIEKNMERILQAARSKRPEEN